MNGSLTMDGFGRRTMIIYGMWTEVDSRSDGLSISWTESGNRPWLFSLDGQRWTPGRRQTVYLMDVFRRWTMRNIKVWTKVDGWTDGRKPVRRGLTGIKSSRKIVGGSFVSLSTRPDPSIGWKCLSSVVRICLSSQKS